MFREVHPHFCNEKYRGFLVTTQSCDLVKRERRCSATHINLSVIRSMEDLISDVMKDKFGCLAPGIYIEERKRFVEMAVERIINQNEYGLGLFYLYPDIDSGIPLHSVAILRVSISVRAEEHYQTLVDARIGRLEQSFQSRLGWISGNLYSRVAVKDWKDQSSVNEDDLKLELLRFQRTKPIWISSKIRKKLKKEGVDITCLSDDEIETNISRFQEQQPKEKIIKRVMNLVQNKIPKVKKENLEQLQTHLENDVYLDSIFQRLLKDSQIDTIECPE